MGGRGKGAKGSKGSEGGQRERRGVKGSKKEQRGAKGSKGFVVCLARFEHETRCAREFIKDTTNPSLPFAPLRSL